LKDHEVDSQSWNQEVPWTSMGGVNDGLTLVFKKNAQFNKDSVCYPLALYLHAPDEVPWHIDVESIYQIEYGKFVDVIITPKVMNSDEDLRQFSVEERNCYYDGEKELRYFKKYTINNCEIECMTNYTREECSCVPFHLPRDNETRICKLYDLICIEHTIERIRYNVIEETTKSCGCLPKCNSITYDVEYVENKFINDGSFNEDDVTINIRFKDSDFLPQKRFQSITLVDLLAQVAGLMGLYSGISVLSIVELFYFFTLRAGSNISRRAMRRRKTRVFCG